MAQPNWKFDEDVVVDAVAKLNNELPSSGVRFTVRSSRVGRRVFFSVDDSRGHSLCSGDRNNVLNHVSAVREGLALARTADWLEIPR